ncbi:MAG: ribonuclease III [Phycisphaerae bacterium]
MADADLAARAQQITGHSFRDPNLLITALTHASGASSRLESNERLEFLGDAVLGLVVCEDLYRRFPDWLEGNLTKVKSVVVSRRVCAQVADEMGLSDLLILGNGVESQGRMPPSLRAAVFETIIGALDLDGGYEVARRFVLNAIGHHIDTWSTEENRDSYKSTLQQHVQRWFTTTPVYETLDEQGPDHSKCFEVCVVIGHRRFPSAWGPSKKAAEQEAARRALNILRKNPSADGDEPVD